MKNFFSLLFALLILFGFGGFGTFMFLLSKGAKFERRDTPTEQPAPTP